jgi:predicted RNase H-like HicB family nuclease
MRRKYSLIIEGNDEGNDEGDDAGYSAYVPELPTVVVTGRNIEDLTASAKEAVRIYWETLRAERSPSATIREIEVELPV